MYFDSLADFLAMGKHAPYVWSAYGVTFAVVLWNVLQPWRTRRQLIQEQAAQLRREKKGATPRGGAVAPRDGAPENR
ncbi:MAG TPA: heme exporter protein CcmD [Moraxellaceae bacterium]|nr:heme exporter protein CcmD [Moraxellaceae bacterium]